MKCHICNRELSKNGVGHIYKCDKRERTLVKHDYIIYNNSQVDWSKFESSLQSLYVEEGYSVVEIASTFNIVTYGNMNLTRIQMKNFLNYF
ncbi:hypothetical protein JZU46_06205 [bacterium]|nr:hypothetical protein [bacterium]